MKIIKNILFFTLLFFVGVIAFSIIGVLLYESILVLPFFLSYVFFTIFAIIKSQGKYHKYAWGMVSIYLMLMIYPFPRCNFRGYWTGAVERCDCVGVLKTSAQPGMEYSESECIGFSYNHYNNDRDGSNIPSIREMNEN